MEIFHSLKARAKDFKKSLWVNGLVETIKLTYSTFADRNFDKLNNMNTSESKLIEAQLQINGQLHSDTYYLPTRGRPFIEFLLNARFAKEFTFVDLGCGRGRALWLAKNYGFKKVIGVEIDSELAADSKKNLVSQGLIEGKDFEIYHLNAADFLPLQSQNIFFFYGPYMSDTDIKKAVQNLVNKKKDTGLDQFFIYHCNVLTETPLDKEEALVKIADKRFSGNRFFTYRVR